MFEGAYSGVFVAAASFVAASFVNCLLFSPAEIGHSLTALQAAAAAAAAATAATSLPPAPPLPPPSSRPMSPLPPSLEGDIFSAAEGNESKRLVLDILLTAPFTAAAAAEADSTL